MGDRLWTCVISPTQVYIGKMEISFARVWFVLLLISAIHAGSTRVLGTPYNKLVEHDRNIVKDAIKKEVVDIVQAKLMPKVAKEISEAISTITEGVGKDVVRTKVYDIISEELDEEALSELAVLAGRQLDLNDVSQYGIFDIIKDKIGGVLKEKVKGEIIDLIKDISVENSIKLLMALERN